MDEKYDLSFNEYFKDKDLTNSMDPLTGSAPRRPRSGGQQAVIVNKQKTAQPQW